MNDKESDYLGKVAAVLEVKGEERKARHLLDILEKVRYISRITTKTSDGRTRVTFVTSAHKPYEAPKETKVSKYPQRDGHLLILTESPTGIRVEIKEDLSVPNSRRNLEQTVTLIEALTGSKADYIREEGNMEAVINVKTPAELTNKGAETQLYRNLCASLIERLKEVEIERRADPAGLKNNVEFYTHLGLPKVERTQKLTKLAYFLRELYGLIEINSGVTREEIISDNKSRRIGRARHVMMYIVRTKFSWLSSNEIGTIFGPPDHPKHHVTILVTTKKFNPKKGINPERYREKDAETLYKDALMKYKNSDS